MSYYPPPPYGYPPPPSGGNRAPIIIGLAVVAVALIVGVVVIVVATGGDDGDGDQGDGDGDGSSTETSVAAPVTLDQLRPALVGADAVGEGFEAGEADVGNDYGDTMIEATGDCRNALDTLAAAETEAVEAVFMDDDDTFVEHQLAPVATSPGIDELASLADECTPFPFTPAGNDGTGEIQVATEPIDGVGDQAIGVELDYVTAVDGNEYTLHAYAVIFVSDGVIATVFTNPALGSGSESDEADQQLARDVANASESLLADVIGG